MAVRIGSARIDERGRASGGKAGNQTGGELSTQNWYLHSKGWRVLRPISTADATMIAFCMEAACANRHIGYDQGQRNSLYNAAKKVGFDTSKVTSDVETDCSALVRVCCAFAGITVGDFNTSSEANALLKTGFFVEKTDSKYTKKSDYLKKGDILVTRSKGHTVVVLSDGPKAEATPEPTPNYTLGGRILRNGMEGKDVRELQTMLIQAGYSCGSYGADGEYGDATELAVISFQKDHQCQPDGEVGPETLAALEAALGGDTQTGTSVRIVGGQCYVRTGPTTDFAKLGVAKENTVWPYAGQQSVDGWLMIEHSTGKGWVSGKYAELIP